MAYAALVSLESVIIQLHRHNVQAGYISFPIAKGNLQFFQPQPHQEYRCIRVCGEEKMESLHDSINVLLKHLEEFPQKCASLESRIRGVAHHLEDIIESFMSGPPYYIRQSDGYGKEMHWAQMVSAFDVNTQNLNSIVEETSKIIETDSDNHDDMCIDENMASASSTGISRSGKDTMVGFDEDLAKILDRVTGHDPALQFIPIVGMGGIGKTTLARNVYDHPSIVEHFDIRSWVTVSQDYSLRDILLGLLSFDKRNQENDKSLIGQLLKKLIGQRIFIVLDDMWDAEVWDKIMRAFRENQNNGSRIIITTRLTKVALEIIDSSSSIHQMKLLNQDQSWCLMCEKVFGKNDPCPPQLEEIGKKTVMNCKGLPLAIVVIAGLLRGNNSQDYWEEIARNVSKTAATDDQLNGILSVSYNNLPHHMKACLLYMGAFPEDYRVDSKLIVRLCVAEGFVKPKGGKSMETVAKECFEDLARRNLVMQEPHSDETGGNYFSLHDILRDLCLKKAAEEYSLVHCKDNFIDEIAKGHRRIIFDGDVKLDLLTNRGYTSSLRSSIYVGFSSFYHKHVPMLFSIPFMLLRVLHNLTMGVEYHYLMTYDDSILFKLIHLRHLCIQGDSRGDHSGKIHISTSLVQLQYLKTLEFISFVHWNIILPWNIWKMPDLVHLHNSHYGMHVSDLHHCSGISECLQSFTGVTDFKFTNDAVERFTNLKSLSFRCGGSEDGWAEYHLDNLVHLHHLEDLEVLNHYRNPGPLPTNLAFPGNLKKLILNGYEIQGEIMSKMSLLLNLEFLKLDNCLFKGELFEEEFHQLKYLEIVSLKHKEWIINATNFPCLEELCLVDCHNIEIPISIGYGILTLEKLEVSHCWGKTVESAKRIQDKQLGNSNSTFQMLILAEGVPLGGEDEDEEEDED